MWNSLLASLTYLITIVVAATKNFEEYNEFLDYYESEIDIEDGDGLWAEIDDQIEAKEEQYSRYRRQTLIESPRLGRGRESPSRVNSGVDTCPARCSCPNSKEVHCTFKFLSKVPGGISRNVEKLNLGFNKIVEIHSRSFDRFSATLGYLYLHSNDIRSLGNGLFSKMDEIKVLRLSWNKITGIRKASLHGLDKIERLYLDNNRLTFIHPLAFRGLVNLKLLQLDNNRLSRLHQNVFITLEFQKYFRHSSVEYLYLAKNQFVHLPRHLFDDMVELRNVYLHDNKWDCSCEMKWFKRWIETEQKYKCKKNSRLPREEECAVCNWPPLLRGKRLQDIPSGDFSCKAPIISTSLGTDSGTFDLDLLEEDNEIALFHASGFYSAHINLRLDSYNRSMIHARCDLTKKPKIKVVDNSDDREIPAKTYSTSFDGQFRCFPEYPAKSKTLKRLLGPYLDEDMQLKRLELRRHKFLGNTKAYSISVTGSHERPVTPLTGGSISSVSKFLTSEFLIMSLESDSANSENNQFVINLRTSFNHTHDPEGVKYSKQPWLLIRQPEPSAVDVVLALERKTLTHRCKAVGQPKPTITWILPTGDVLRPGEGIGRITVGRSGRLVIRRPIPENSGYYRCLATIPETRNATGYVSSAVAEISTLKIDVFSRSQSYSLLQTGLIVENIQPGDRWTSTCNVEGLPNSTIGWITPDEHLLVGKDEEEDGRIETTENGRITIKNFTQSDQGLFRCVAANVVGKSEYSIFVSIPSKDYEQMETIEEPELKEQQPGIPIVLPTTDIKTSGESEIEDKESTKTKTSAVSESVTPPDSSPVPKENDSPDIESPKISSSKYFNFLDTPSSYNPDIVEVESNYRTHRPGGFVSTPTTTSNLDAKEVPSPLQEVEILTKRQKDRKQHSIRTPRPIHPHAPPPVDGPNRHSQTLVNQSDTIAVPSATSPQPPLTTSLDSVVTSTTSSSTMEVATTTTESHDSENIVPSTTVSQTSVTSTSSSVVTTTTPRVPSRRVQGAGFVDVPARSIHRGVTSGDVPAKSIHQLSPSAATPNWRNVRYGSQGGRVNLPCIPGGEDYPPRGWTFEWTLPSGELYMRPNKIVSSDWTKYVHRNGSLSVHSLTSRDSGTYSCLATDMTEGDEIEYHADVRLVVRSNRPQISNPTREYVTLQSGESLFIDCDASGYPRPRVSWRTPWGTTTYEGSRDGRVEVFRNGTLYIHEIKRLEQGSYTCFARNSGGTKTRTVVIRVPLRRPRFLGPRYSTRRVRAGERVVLSCEATGTPPPTYYWLLPNGDRVSTNQAVFLNGYRREAKYVVRSNGNFILNRASRSDSGRYHCVISNFLGKAASTMNLIVT